MQQTIQIGQVVQPSVLSSVESTVKNCKAWWSAKSEWFSAIAGECVKNGEVVKAHAVAVGVLAVIGLGGALL